MATTGDLRTTSSPGRRPAVGVAGPLSLPLLALLTEVGGIAQLAYLVLKRGLSRPFSWGPEFAEQLGFTLKMCFFPLVLSSFALAFGPIGVQASGLFQLFGAFDRFGSVYELIEVREFAPLVIGIVLAGAAGTAICADLGARVVREEISALNVMGVDPIRNLVVPRVFALICPLYC